MECGVTYTEVKTEEARWGPSSREGTGVIDTEPGKCINDATINVEEVSAVADSAVTVNGSRWAMPYMHFHLSVWSRRCWESWKRIKPIVPHWPTAEWYPQMLKLRIRTSILSPRGKSGPLRQSSSSTKTASTSSSLLIRKAVQVQGRTYEIIRAC